MKSPLFLLLFFVVTWYHVQERKEFLSVFFARDSSEGRMSIVQLSEWSEIKKRLVRKRTVGKRKTHTHTQKTITQIRLK